MDPPELHAASEERVVWKRRNAPTTTTNYCCMSTGAVGTYPSIHQSFLIISTASVRWVSCIQVQRFPGSQRQKFYKKTTRLGSCKDPPRLYAIQKENTWNGVPDNSDPTVCRRWHVVGYIIVL